MRERERGLRIKCALGFRFGWFSATKLRDAIAPALPTSSPMHWLPGSKIPGCLFGSSGPAKTQRSSRIFNYSETSCSTARRRFPLPSQKNQNTGPGSNKSPTKRGTKQIGNMTPHNWICKERKQSSRGPAPTGRKKKSRKQTDKWLRHKKEWKKQAQSWTRFPRHFRSTSSSRTPTRKKQ